MPTYQNAIVIDDDAIALMLCERLLRISNFAENIKCFDSGSYALSWIKDNFESKPVLPDIIFLDLHLPKIDGFTFLQKIEELFGKGRVPDVYVLSSTFFVDDEQKINQYPFVKKIIIKPLTMKDLEDGLGSTHHENVDAPL